MSSPSAKARSASAAQASLKSGYLAATSAGSVAASRADCASGRSGSRVGSGPEEVAVRHDVIVRHDAAAPAHARQSLRPADLRCSAGLDDTGGHRLLGHLQVAARVVGLLVADLAVDLQHAVVVAEHVVGDRRG